MVSLPACGRHSGESYTHQADEASEPGEGLGVNIATVAELLLDPRRGARNCRHMICDLQNSPANLGA